MLRVDGFHNKFLEYDLFYGKLKVKMYTKKKEPQFSMTKIVIISELFINGERRR